MDYCDILRKSKELRILSEDLRRDISKKMVDMGHYTSRIFVSSDYVQIKTYERLNDIEIRILEEEYNFKMTLCRQVIIRDNGEPFSYGDRDGKTFIYRFRGQYK